MRLLATTLALAAALATGAACDPASLTPDQAPGATGPGAGATAGAATSSDLDSLTVADHLPMAGYSRDKFHIWAEQGNGCNTREVVLKRDGQAVRTGAGCKVTSGTWRSPYNGRTYTDPLKLDIDHVVPLANAWASGAKNWTAGQRESFANDLTRPQLLAVDLSDNRAKGDQDPAQWRPPLRSFWCTYATDWVTVKAYWRLTVTSAEKTALREMLETCG
ncbi:MAG: HNH endonuclease [Micromonosporaceae bacterium]|nr:HNH endonuclease [Micromonosporaceae bacterium]